MSGLGLVSEGFAEDQVGSSAMPHKINARLSERVNGLIAVLKGNAVMVQELVGNQWNEGDVSCSVVRRVALSDAFYAIDAILDTTIFTISDLVIHREEIQIEVEKHLPFLASTRILSSLLKKGMGREDAYATIKKLVNSARSNLRTSGVNNLFDLVHADSSLELEDGVLDSLLDTKKLTGRAKEQTMEIISKAMNIANSHPKSLGYSPSNLI
jgi:adenylosuccinate lyase